LSEERKRPQGRIKRIASDPLAGFLLIGLLLFVLFDIVGGNRDTDSNRIVIDDRVLAYLIERHIGVWQRAPTTEEIRGLLDDYIREEVLYREGVAAGMLDNDPVVRRRIRQKVSVLAEEASGTDAPTDAQLEQWLKEHAELYAQPPILSFTQVYFDPERIDGDPEALLADALDDLQAGADPRETGDRTMLPWKVQLASVPRINREFGAYFGAALAELPVGEWLGPLRSGFGLHLVRVDEHQPGRPATLDEARAAVERDWETDRRQRAAEDYYQRLLRDTEIVIETELPEGARPEAATP